MLKIKVELFCGLSTNPVWQSWLWQFSPELYQELVAHLRLGKGCGANRDKMIELFGHIQSLPQGSDRLLQFLQAQFPHMVDWGAPEPPPAPDVAPTGVPFEACDPQLLTFPRRLILQDEDQVRLRDRLREFLADKPRSDYAIVSGRAFIEYVPLSGMSVVDQIPEKNWLIARWRRGPGQT